jgi:hypothetical protein
MIQTFVLIDVIMLLNILFSWYRFTFKLLQNFKTQFLRALKV